MINHQFRRMESDIMSHTFTFMLLIYGSECQVVVVLSHGTASLCCSLCMIYDLGKLSIAEFTCTSGNIKQSVLEHWVLIKNIWSISIRRLKGYFHSSCYYHHQIGSINLTHCNHIFPWLCAWDVCYIIYHNTFRENRDFVFIIFVQFMMSANSWIRFGWLVVFVCLFITPSHYHHFVNSSEDIELIKCLSNIFCRVCESYFLRYPQYNIWGCMFPVYHFPCDDWDNIYIYFVLLSSSNRKYELLPIV